MKKAVDPSTAPKARRGSIPSASQTITESRMETTAKNQTPCRSKMGSVASP